MKQALLALALLFAAPQVTFSQPTTTGEIALEPGEEKLKPAYERGQDDAIDQLTKVSRSVNEGKAEAISLSDNGIAHLTAVYLLCTVNQGTCPLVLNAVLETDIINAKLSGQMDCPLMRRFWQYWIKNDMEKRYQYMAKTAFITEATNFQKNERPKFIRCSSTVKEVAERHRSDSTSDFLRNRYKGEQNPFPETLKLLQQMKLRHPNIFTAIGAAKAQPTE